MSDDIYCFPAVLKCLQARYSMKVFYTHAGCTLVALNPFQPIPDLYTLDVMKEYHCAPQPQVFQPVFRCYLDNICRYVSRFVLLCEKMNNCVANHATMQTYTVMSGVCLRHWQVCMQ